MTHAEFVHGYRSGSIRVDIDPTAAARYLSARLLLPFFALPVLGLGVAVALLGWLWLGFGLLAAGTLAPVVIKRSAPHFIVTQALHDEKLYADVVDAGLLQIRDVS